MTRSFLTGMAQATALTRLGKLAEATRHIQQTLRRAPVTAPAEVSDADGSVAVIEGTYTRVPQDTQAPDGRVQPTPTPPAHSAVKRTSLGATLRALGRGRVPEQGRQAARDMTTDPAMTMHRSDSSAGSREFLLFLPQSLADGPRPVLIMLHGCTQSPQDFAAGTGMNALAQGQGMIVVYPAQPSAANVNKCWNWFRPQDQQRDTGELAVLAAMTHQVLTEHGGDPTRVYVAGLSAGGAAAVQLAQAYPDLFAAVGVHSGLAAGVASSVPEALSAMRSGAVGQPAKHIVPTIVFHGTADTIVHVANAQAVARQAQHGMVGDRTSTKSVSQQGRSYSRSTLTAKDGQTMAEVWLIDGAGHAWSGGTAAGSYTDPTGPDASGEMLRFFRQHRQSRAAHG